MEDKKNARRENNVEKLFKTYERLLSEFSFDYDFDEMYEEYLGDPKYLLQESGVARSSFYQYFPGRYQEFQQAFIDRKEEDAVVKINRGLTGKKLFVDITPLLKVLVLTNAQEPFWKPLFKRGECKYLIRLERIVQERLQRETEYINATCLYGKTRVDLILNFVVHGLLGTVFFNMHRWNGGEEEKTIRKLSKQVSILIKPIFAIHPPYIDCQDQKIKVCVHGAAQSIGSSCVEITAGKFHLLLDFGQGLESRGEPPTQVTDPNKMLYVTVLSHAHLDHTGFANSLPEASLIYCSEQTKKVVESAYYFRMTDLNPDRLLAIAPGKAITFHPFKITLLEVGHSVLGACAVRIDVFGKTLLYTGDYRGHNPKDREKLQAIIDQVKNPDYLITEATFSINTSNNEYVQSEKEVCSLLSQEFSLPGRILMKTSSQNISRMETIRKACRQTGRILIYDPYTAEILQKATGTSADGIQEQVFCIPNRYTQQLQEDGKLQKYGRVKVRKDALLENPDKYVVICNQKMLAFFFKENIIADPNTRIFWSMWKGYIDTEPFLANRKDSLIICHSSGHVTAQDFQWFIKAIQPRRVLLMHSFNPSLAADYIRNIENGPDSIDILQDHQEITL